MMTMKKIAALIVVLTLTLYTEAQVEKKMNKPQTKSTVGTVAKKSGKTIVDTATASFDTAKVRIVYYAKDGDQMYLTFEDGFMVTESFKYQYVSKPLQGNQFLFTKKFEALGIKPEDIYDIRNINWK